jgi:hypothetical protein
MELSRTNLGGDQPALGCVEKKHQKLCACPDRPGDLAGLNDRSRQAILQGSEQWSHLDALFQKIIMPGACYMCCLTDKSWGIQ